jgi:hypothetical protein
MPCRPLWYNRFSHNWKLASLIHAMRDMLRRSSLAASKSPVVASSRRMEAPRLHEWIEMTDAILNTIKISSRVAPASSAARMCRRVPFALRFVQATLSDTLINSTVFVFLQLNCIS